MNLLVTGLQKSNLPACPPEGRASVLEKDTVEPWLYHEIEALIPRLTKYARALTHDVVDADDLVQEFTQPSACKASSVAPRHQSASLALHDNAPSICQ